VLPSVLLCGSFGREKHGGKGTLIFETARAVGDFVPFSGHPDCRSVRQNRSLIGFRLVSSDFLGHVQQELLVARFHFCEEPAQFGEVIGFAAPASEFVILWRFELAQ
jgi:hypothetical protein